MPSVGATANLLLAAATAKGQTVIRNAAAEPHVAALAEFLCAAGAQIKGIGTDTVRVFGVSRLHGVAHRIIPDMIEAGTYLCAGVACHGPVTVTQVEPAHLAALLRAFRAMGAEVEEGESWVRVACLEKYRNIRVETAPYPGFPTDLHPQLTALFSLDTRAEGEGEMRERIWHERFRYVHGLQKMGADIAISGECAAVRPAPLHAACVRAPDLRGGAAILLAMLATKGRSELTNACMLARGYEHLEKKLAALGASVRIC
jgi:UDP-N-acetylglucosamine 1-carboxyvinyltransferase